ncbi:bifunctional HSP20-like chaperone/CS domain [Babesia duncani]|uniref:Bifunctional HSP20-like chaperone/CS domain n=1 Tax=Babesia duncani TaxID=323732 RepID=A0AAD9PMJ7_9APIC|nr:bifunctional HSP20-like chaperone/CS domain [Babesia duncani]KAK2194705.1 bifunctional HSP20-like chaperone/CS domain [Babesia duncani]KAK2197557.1 bifunctional HSP20-like chaperone/CS domain [Babesia duncani]
MSGSHDAGDGPGSGNGESLSHGLQQNAIYWETGHRTYLPFWASLVIKFTPKIIDDKIRSLLGEAEPISHQPFVFYGNSGYFRSYYGDPDVSVIQPIKKRTNFCMNPTGTKTLGILEQNLEKYGDVERSIHETVFLDVIRSAKQIDLMEKLPVLSFQTNWKRSIDCTLGYLNPVSNGYHYRNVRLGDTDVTEADVLELQQLINDIKSGKHGEKMMEEFKEAERVVDEQTHQTCQRHPEYRDDMKKPDINEILKTEDKELDQRLNNVFDIAAIPSEAKDDGFNLEKFSKRLEKDQGNISVSTSELQSVVHTIYRESGLLTEPFKRLDLGPVVLMWTQNLTNVDIWFTVDPADVATDFDIKILPTSLIASKRGNVLFSKTLYGKINCDASFWTMFKNPSGATKYININLTKRKPNYNIIWKALLVESQTPTTDSPNGQV